MHKATGSVWMMTCSLALAACGGSSDDEDMPAPAPAAPPVRGSLIQSPPARTASVSAADLATVLANQPGAQELLGLIVAPKCGIDVHHVQYNTVDPAGAPTTASAALMIPTGADPVCQGPRPIVVYAHGTAVQRSLNLANITSEDNLEGLLAATVFTTQGYILVAPNYTGFDISALSYNPYLNADQQAKDAVDAFDGSAQRAADQLRTFRDRFRQVVRHRLLARRSRRNGHTQAAAGDRRGNHGVGADVRAVCHRGVLGCSVLRPGQSHHTAVPDVHCDRLSESLRRRLREPD